MNIRLRTFAALAIAATGVLTTSLAQAGSDVRWSVSIGVPMQVYDQPFYRQPQPVYYEPAPVYIQPRPVYVQPPPVYYGRPVEYGDPVEYRYRDRYEHAQRHHWERDHDHDHHRDRDRDGVPDRYDGRPGNPWRH